MGSWSVRLHGGRDWASGLRRSSCSFIALHLESLNACSVLDYALLSIRINVPIGALDGAVRQSGLLPEALAPVVLARVVAEL